MKSKIFLKIFPHTAMASDLVFTPDSKHLLAGLQNTFIEVYDIE
jgi:hypothetical protein